MQIDRSNYEIWLIDWLDGNLSDLQVRQLKLFLSENPELREEFNDLTSFNLKPSNKSLQDKDRLKKSTADLSRSQFEYLCIANLENDLSPGQQTELKQIIDQEPEKKKTFELFQKMRLAPEGISYRQKKHLFKRTPAQRVIRLSVIVLSAAAAVALVVMTYLIIPRNLSDKNTYKAQNIIVDSSLAQPSLVEVPDKIIRVKKPVTSKQKEENLFAGIQKKSIVTTQPDLTVSAQNDSLHRNPANPEIYVDKIPVHAEFDLQSGIISNTLISSNITFMVPPDDEERSNVSRFIAKTFREKILKEKPSKDSPLKVYEIAEAGVTGLNKLLGWEMALNKNNDENGELRSVYFSSKILKFNAPVKKTLQVP